jgi:hypothetical protein
LQFGIVTQHDKRSGNNKKTQQSEIGKFLFHDGYHLKNEKEVRRLRTSFED